MTEPSIERLAAALRVSTRTVNRDRTRGLPWPRKGEPLEEWAARAREWKKQNRAKPGRPREDPKPVSESAAEARYRMAKAEIAELQLAKMRAELHSQAECESLMVRRLQELRAAVAQLPDKLGRRLYQAPSPDAIKLIVEEELRRCFEVLADGGHVADSGDAPGTSVA